MEFPSATPPSVFFTWHDYIDDLVYARDDAMNPILPHQREALKETKLAFESKHHHMQFVMPEKSGKTGLAVLLPYFLTSQKVIAIAPTQEGAEHLAIQFFGPEISTDHFPTRQEDAFMFKIGIDPRENVRTNRELRTSVLPRGSIVRDLNRISKHDELMIFHVQEENGARFVNTLPKKNVDLLIVDDAELYSTDAWSNIRKRYENIPIIFLTGLKNKYMRRIYTWEHTGCIE